MPEIERVLAAYRSSIGRVVASYAASADERDDLWQEIALALLRALPRFRGECSEKSYVLRIAHNCGIRHLWRQKRQAPTPRDPPDRAPDDRPGAEAVAARQEEGARLRAAITQLPLGLRQALTLALEDLTHKEIAEVLGIKENAVAVRLHRARKALESLLEADDGR
jgi:RNA polymerase sigma-70 factor (ECF subfamily)